MADYDTNKRKYHHHNDGDTSPSPPPPPRRRPTGFSAPITEANPDQPPANEFDIVKQQLKEIASRALNSDLKRSKFDNNGGGGGGGGGYGYNYNSSSDPKSYSNIQAGNVTSIPASHSFSGSKKIEIPNGRVGVIIGKAGETIKYLQIQSRAKIQITRDAEHDPNMSTRTVELMGSPDEIAKAEQLINEVLAEAEAGGPGSASRRHGAAPGSEPFAMKVPTNKVGLVIGKGGETIKNIQSRSGARVQVIPLHPPPGDTSNERTVQIDGTTEQIEVAKQMVYEVIENRVRNPASAGGYPQQGYQAQAPPMNWTSQQPTQPQQTGGYGYMQQSGAYPGAPSQYNASQQQPHSGYPQPASGGYAQNWDPSSAPQNQSGGNNTQGTGYDYYSQQQMPPQQQSGSQTGNSGYYYNQQPGGYGQQGYSQDGYGQPQANPQSGYDQQQYGYSATPGYGNVTNPPNASSQGETGQVPPQQGYMGQPSPNPAYPNQAGYGTQAGYGAPSAASGGGYGPNYGAQQGQRTPPNPSSYGQPQQSPSQTSGGYAQPSSGQPGYPTSQTTVQPGYGQPDAAGVPQSSAAAYPSTYGAPPVTPPSYGQHPSYYGGGYAQQPAYPPTDGNVAPPAPGSQGSSQPGGADKTSSES